MTLAYDRTGAGEPVVLLHPLGADRCVWDAVAERLADRYELVAVDLPGFGGSPPLVPAAGASGDHSPAALARATADFLAEIGVTQPHVAGNSLGGWVALELALRHDVSSAIGIAPAGLWSRALGPKPPLARTLARIGLPLIVPAARSRRGRRLLLSGAATHPERVDTGQAVRLIRSYATAPGFRAVNAAMRSGRFTALDQIEVPVTLVWPEHDTLVRRPRQLPPLIDNVELPGAGHIPMLDHPDEVAAIIDAAITAARRSEPRRAAR